MLDGTNSRLNDTGKWISKLDGRVVKITTTKQKDGRKWRGTKKPLDETEKGEWKSWLKAQHSKN